MNFPFNNKGFLDKLFDKGVDLIGSLFNKGAESASSVVGGAIGSKLGDKIQGIPSALSASEQGQQAADYMNAAYPGTTAWDRLGVGGGGSTSATGGQNIEQMKIKNENKMQSRELVTRSLIADRQNLTHLISSASSLGIPAIKEVINAYRGAKSSDYDNPNLQARELLPAKKHADISKGNRDQANIKGEATRSDRMNEIIDAENHQRYFASPTSASASASKMFSDQLATSNRAVGQGFKAGFDGVRKWAKNFKLPFRLNFSPIPKN
nr:MAG: DNA pilot protein [Microvirus sp.]